jgi:hypothetical protein
MADYSSISDKDVCFSTNPYLGHNYKHCCLREIWSILMCCIKKAQEFLKLKLDGDVEQL